MNDSWLDEGKQADRLRLLLLIWCLALQQNFTRIQSAVLFWNDLDTDV